MAVVPNGCFRRRVREAGAEIVTEAPTQKWGDAGIFADPDGHMGQVTRTGGVLTPDRTAPVGDGPRRRDAGLTTTATTITSAGCSCTLRASR